MKNIIEYINELKTVEDKGIYVINSLQNEKYISYGTLYKNAVKFGSWLNSIGIDHKQELIISVQELENYFYIFWGCIIYGIKAVPLKLDIGNLDTLKTLFDICKDKNIITDDTNLFNQIERDFDTCKELNNLFYSLDILDNIKDDIIPPEYKEDSSLYILFSSGSTSGTKGVEIYNEGLIENMLSIAERSQITENDSMLGWISLYHAFGLSNTHLISVVCKLNQYMVPTDVFLKDPLILLDLATKYKITMSAVTNFSLNFILKTLLSDKYTKHNWDLSSLRSIYNASEPISAAVCDDFSSELEKYGYKSSIMKPTYGMTESVSLITLPMIEDEVYAYPANKECLKVGLPLSRSKLGDDNCVSITSLGYPLSGMKVRVTDLFNNDLGKEVVGILQLAGNSILKKYYSFEESALVDGWFNTGDIGFIHNDQVFISSRLKFMFIYNGKSYYCNELEDYIVSNGIAEKNIVYLIGFREKADDINDSILCYINYDGEIDVSFAQRAIAVEEAIEEKYGVIINKIIPINEIPKSSSGKVQRFKMQESYTKGYFDDDIDKIYDIMENLKKDDNGIKSIIEQINDSSDIEIILEEFLLDKLKMDVDVSMNFISMGLTSMNLTQFLSLIDREFKIDISISDLFEYPNIQILSEFIYGKLSDIERK